MISEEYLLPSVIFCYSTKNHSLVQLISVMKVKMRLSLLLQQDCVRFVMTKRLNVSSFRVVMPEPVKSVLQGSRTLASHVLIVGSLCQQYTAYICSYLLDLYSEITNITFS